MLETDLQVQRFNCKVVK